MDNAELRFRSVLKAGTTTQNHSDLSSMHQPDLTCNCQTFPMQHETSFPAVDDKAHAVASRPDMMNAFTAFPQNVRASLTAELELGPCLRLDPGHNEEQLKNVSHWAAPQGAAHFWPKKNVINWVSRTLMNMINALQCCPTW